MDPCRSVSIETASDPTRTFFISRASEFSDWGLDWGRPYRAHLGENLLRSWQLTIKLHVVVKAWCSQ